MKVKYNLGDSIPVGYRNTENNITELFSTTEHAWGLVDKKTKVLKSVKLFRTRKEARHMKKYFKLDQYEVIKIILNYEV